MRYMEVTMYPDWETFPSLKKRLFRDPDIRRRKLHALKLLDDGTVAVLAEVDGDLDRYREILREAPEVRRFAVSGDESGYCYSQIEPTPTSKALLQRRDEEEFIVEMPMTFTEDGGLQMTIVGSESDLAAVPDLFDEIDVELDSTGPYYPGAGDAFSGLTDRQKEALTTAVRRGYYETPREATLDDLGEALGVDPGTVGRHLRAVESTVFAEFVP
ncbi:helix-turn-helix domain-containing protein [Haloarcula salinisoli]|uniref:Helix-turn-helix domain-containing protein n=1 Tax=Haloarcula salinisoli TaxID=2487746 RepID=A0A8J8C8U9_9EURY|nr:helix-turn-helix domain-containing protein [Halomicroarcula salinisoli]MBX0304811.1 helix-turn-helix domain-containing protein [Halomicroarcula salinisoli]